MCALVGREGVVCSSCALDSALSLVPPLMPLLIRGTVERGHGRGVLTAVAVTVGVSLTGVLTGASHGVVGCTSETHEPVSCMLGLSPPVSPSLGNRGLGIPSCMRGKQSGSGTMEEP